MARRKTFLFNTDWANIARQFPPEVQLAIYDGLIDYIATGEEPKLSETARMGFMFIRRELDDINAKYEARVAQNKANGSKGGAPKGNRNAKKKGSTETTAPEVEQPETTENNPTQPKKTTSSRKGKKRVETAPETVDFVEVVAETKNEEKTTAPEVEQPETTENNPTQPKKTTSSRKGKKRVETAPETVDFVEVVAETKNEEKTTAKIITPQTVEILEVADTTENNQNQPNTSETTLYDNMIYGELNKFNSFNVVVDNAREVDFLNEFFAAKNAYSIEVLCMQEHTTAQQLAQYAQEIIAEWQLRGESHTDYKEASRHLINHLRKKFEAARRAKREEDAAPKSRQQAREDLIRGAVERLTNAIGKDGASPATAGDTQPF